MKRRIKEFIEIEDHNSIDDLITRLIEVRDSLPPESEAELRLRATTFSAGSVDLLLPRPDRRGAEFETRYAAAQEAREKELAGAGIIGVFCYARARKLPSSPRASRWLPMIEKSG